MFDKHPSKIEITNFNYELPASKIAAYPLKNRDESKLLVYKNQKIQSDKFINLDTFINKKSVLVFNNSKVIHARLNFINSNNKEIEIFCLEPDSIIKDMSIAMALKKTATWHCLVGNLKNWKEEWLVLNSKLVTLKAKIVERKINFVTVIFEWEPIDLCFSEMLSEIGSIPIPPYLKRKSDKDDQSRYQTIYASQNGSVAAPTAGLHFTDKIFKKLKTKSVKTIDVTLHVGAGTFKPIKTETLNEHIMHAEWIEVDILTIKSIIKNIANDIIAVGTTSLRTIETLHWMGVKLFLNPNQNLQDVQIYQWDVYELIHKNIDVTLSLTALINWMQLNNLKKLICQTQILIAPPYQLQIVKGIITNFHQPQSTLLLLISSIVGNSWKEIYRHALDHDYRFLSYGDSSLLFK